MSEDSTGGRGGGCSCGGCIMLIVFFFMVVAIGWGLPIGKRKWNVDIWPPRIWDMNEEVEEKKPVEGVPITTPDGSTVATSDTPLVRQVQ